MMIFGRPPVQNRHAVSITLLILFTSISAACHEPGLRRTSFDEWKVEVHHLLGARVEVPVDYFYSGGDSRSEAGYLMHPVWPPRGVIDEPMCILEVRLMRWSLEEVERRRAAVEKKKTDKEKREFWRWINAPHETIDRIDTGGQVIFRYDVACRHDSILVIDAVTRKMGGEKAKEWLEEDEKAIRRILASAECLEQIPLPKLTPSVPPQGELQ